jgi:hypothetical protein
MNTLLSSAPPISQERTKQLGADQEPARFRKQFQRSLRSCVDRRFSVEECFGTIWQETLEEIAITGEQESKLYPDLLEWARQLRK